MIKGHGLLDAFVPRNVTKMSVFVESMDKEELYRVSSVNNASISRLNLPNQKRFSAVHETSGPRIKTGTVMPVHKTWDFSCGVGVWLRWRKF